MAIDGLTGHASIGKGTEVTTGMRWNRILAFLSVVCAIVLGVAWLDGGHEPLDNIVKPIPVPEIPQ